MELAGPGSKVAAVAAGGLPEGALCQVPVQESAPEHTAAKRAVC